MVVDSLFLLIVQTALEPDPMDRTDHHLEAGRIVADVGTTHQKRIDAARGRSSLDFEEALVAESAAAARATELIAIGLEIERALGLEGWRGVLPRLREMATETEMMPC
jgi:hypothetical protein